MHATSRSLAGWIALPVVGFVSGGVVGIVTGLLSLAASRLHFDANAVVALILVTGLAGGVCGAVLFPAYALLARRATVARLAILTTIGGVAGVLVCGYARISNVFASGDAPVVCAAVGSFVGAVVARAGTSRTPRGAVSS